MVIAGGALAAAEIDGVAAARGPDRDTEAAPVDGAAALRRLQAGNQRFVTGEAKGQVRHTTRRAELAEGQAPFGVVLGCSDSRVPPEIVFDQGLGDLFLVRVAGNTATDPIVIGSIQYSVLKLKSVLLMVLGHEDCGAVKAAVDVAKNGTTFPGQIGSFVQPIVPAVQDVQSQPADAIVNAAIQQNVRRAVTALRAEPLLADLVAKNTLMIVGAEYHLHTGRVQLVT